MTVVWTQNILVDGKETSLRDWIASIYTKLTDQQVADVMTKSGIPCTRKAVRAIRLRWDLRKASGNYVRRSPKAKDDIVISLPEEQSLVEVGASIGEVLVDAQGISRERLLRTIKNKPRSMRELSKLFDRSETTIAMALDELRQEHYNIQEIDSAQMLDTRSVPPPPPPAPRTLADERGMYIKLAIASDLHAGSMGQQITNMRRFIRDAFDKGVRVVVVPGDLFAGIGVYRGQIHDLFATQADLQLRVLVEVLPRIEGLSYYVIGGNHDYSFIKASGFNIVAAFAAARDDVTYLGYDMAHFPITEQADLRLWHPSGGVPYAVSYRLQKGLEQIAYDELQTAIHTGDNPKMRIVASGHLHVSMTMWRGPILGLQSGCFEGQTNYLKRKAMFPQVGGYIVEIWLTESGLIQRARCEFVPFIEIEDDYLNYPDLLDSLNRSHIVDNMVPLYTWEPREEEGAGGEEPD